MPFEIPYHKELVFEGNKPWALFPSEFLDSYKQKDLIRNLKKYLEDGGQVFVEFVKGARKGSVARVVIQSEDLDDLYKEVKNYRGTTYRVQRTIWKLKWDDRNNEIDASFAYDAKCQFVMRFDKTETVWAYLTKERPKEEAAVLYDHFGVQLEVGQHILYPHGRKGDISTRFGHITSISPKGTVKVKPIKTRSNHGNEELNLSPTIGPKDIVVLDAGDIKDKVVMAKLTHG